MTTFRSFNPACIAEKIVEIIESKKEIQDHLANVFMNIMYKAVMLWKCG